MDDHKATTEMVSDLKLTLDAMAEDAKRLKGGVKALHDTIKVIHGHCVTTVQQTKANSSNLTSLATNTQAWFYDLQCEVRDTHAPALHAGSAMGGGYNPLQVPLHRSNSVRQLAPIGRGRGRPIPGGHHSLTRNSSLRRSIQGSLSNLGAAAQQQQETIDEHSFDPSNPFSAQHDPSYNDVSYTDINDYGMV